MFQNQEQLTDEREMWTDIKDRIERRIFESQMTIEEVVKEEKEKYLFGSEQFLRKKRDKNLTLKKMAQLTGEKDKIILGEQQSTHTIRMEQKQSFGFRDAQEPDIIKKLKN